MLAVGLDWINLRDEPVIAVLWVVSLVVLLYLAQRDRDARAPADVPRRDRAGAEVAFLGLAVAELSLGLIAFDIALGSWLWVVLAVPGALCFLSYLLRERTRGRILTVLAHTLIVIAALVNAPWLCDLLSNLVPSYFGHLELAHLPLPAELAAVGGGSSGAVVLHRSQS